MLEAAHSHGAQMLDEARVSNTRLTIKQRTPGSISSRGPESGLVPQFRVAPLIAVFLPDRIAQVNPQLWGKGQLSIRIGIDPLIDPLVDCFL